MIRRTPPKVPRPAPAPRTVDPRLTALAGDPAAAERFWSEAQGRLPLVQPRDDGQVLVTFCWQDPRAEAVLLFVNRLTDETRLHDSFMERVPGTDLWHLSYVMDAQWRASYCFLARRPGEESPLPAGDDQIRIRQLLDRGEPDPGNPDRCRNRAGVSQSVVSLPQAPPQRWHQRRDDVPRGRVTQRAAPDGRRLWLYEPPVLAQDSPLLIALDGEVWTSSHDLPTILDNLIADALVPPLHAVLVDSGGRDQRWTDLAGDETAAHDALLAGELLDAVRSWLPVSRDPARTVIAGQSLGGLTALRTALRHPDRIGSVVSQSASLWQDDLAASVAEASHDERLRVHLTHGAQEWVLTEPHGVLADRLRAAGHHVETPRYDGGHDYAWWRGAIGDGIVAVLGPR